MKNKFILAALSITAVVTLFSCQDIVQTNLRKKTLTVLAPANNTVSQEYSIFFWWEEVKGAEKYNLQVIKPSFVVGQQLVLDTMVSGTKFLHILQPGAYQWRVRATNNTSSTDYVTYNLTIDSSSKLSLGPLLNVPKDKFYSNSFVQNLSWFPMPNATNYIFTVMKSGVQIGNSQATAETSVSYTFLVEGEYTWRVIGQNDKSVSLYSERTITIDTTKPTIPTITFLPVRDSTILKPVPLTWSLNDNNVKYKVQISGDSFATAAYIVDTTTLELKYNFRNPILNKKYFWRVSAIDSATNVGAYSPIKKVIVH